MVVKLYSVLGWITVITYFLFPSRCLTTAEYNLWAHTLWRVLHYFFFPSIPTILLCFQKITILIKLCKQSLLFIFTFWLPLNWEQWPWLLKILFRCYSSHSFYWCYNAGLKQPSEKQLLLVANAHMHWDPEYSDVKLIQTMMFLSELKSIAERALGSINSGSPTSDTSSIPIVLCADLNSLPDSGEQCLELLIKEK